MMEDMVNLTIVNYRNRNMLLLEDVLFADWLIGYCKIMVNEESNIVIHKVQGYKN
jgi:hypothetical protein